MRSGRRYWRYTFDARSESGLILPGRPTIGAQQMLMGFNSAVSSNANTRLLLNGNGANNAGVFTDSSQYSRTVSGFGSIATYTGVKKYGSASIGASVVSNSATYLQVSDTSQLELGANDFCIEAWVRYTSTVYNGAWSPVISDKSATNQFEHRFGLIGGASGIATMWFYYTTDGSTLQSHNSGSFTPGTGSFAHYAVSRSGSNLYFWRDGTQQGSTGTISGTIHQGTGNWRTMGATGVSISFDGYVDDIRVTIGEARYTSSFTPPAAELTMYG